MHLRVKHDGRGVSFVPAILNRSVPWRAAISSRHKIATEAAYSIVPLGLLSV